MKQLTQKTSLKDLIRQKEKNAKILKLKPTSRKPISLSRTWTLAISRRFPYKSGYSGGDLGRGGGGGEGNEEAELEWTAINLKLKLPIGAREKGSVFTQSRTQK